MGVYTVYNGLKANRGQDKANIQTMSIYFVYISAPKGTLWEVSGIASVKTFQYVQMTLVISNSNELSEILTDIRRLTYQICRIKEKINQTTTFNERIYNFISEIRDILKKLWKRGGAISPLFHNIL